MTVCVCLVFKHLTSVKPSLSPRSDRDRDCVSHTGHITQVPTQVKARTSTSLHRGCSQLTPPRRGQQQVLSFPQASRAGRASSESLPNGRAGPFYTFQRGRQNAGPKARKLRERKRKFGLPAAHSSQAQGRADSAPHGEGWRAKLGSPTSVSEAGERSCGRPTGKRSACAARWGVWGKEGHQIQILEEWAGEKGGGVEGRGCRQTGRAWRWRRWEESERERKIKGG